MPNCSFPESDFSNGQSSRVRTFVGVESKPSFSSFAPSAQESWIVTLSEHQSGFNALLRPQTFHAEPLAPLRKRDERALQEMFDNSQIDEALTDIYTRLRQICPEPCWEDDPYDFLKGYL